MWSFARSYGTVHVGERAISGGTVWRAIAVLVISLGVVVVVAWLLLLSQDVSFSAGLFEVVSALSTTGLSMGITGQLDTVGRLLIGEVRHPGVLTELPLGERLLRAWFQSVAARTAGSPGFADFAQIGEASRLLLVVLMFIGSAPASMGGGITTGSFSVLALAMWSFARNYGTVRVGQRAISPATVWRALAVLVISLGVVVVVSWLLLLTQDVSFSAGIFEVVSAFSTTGLSLGITGQLDTFGRLLIIGAMFWGRLGAVTIMLALLKRGTRQRLVHYPEETVLVG